MDTLKIILLLLTVSTTVTSVRVDGRRSIDPHRNFNGLKPERGPSKRLKNLHRTHCHFHNSTFTLGEKWSPDFDPESEGKNINYCIICECEKREEKNRKGVIKLRSKVNCRNFAAECPEPKCSNPRVYDGHCCKSCSKDDEFERNIRRSNKTDAKAERKGNRKRNFIAILRDAPSNDSSHSHNPPFTFVNAPRIYMHLLKGNLGFILESFGTDKPAYIRFHDLNDTILEEFVIKGNTSSLREYRVHGIWQNMIEEHREMLRSNELKVSLSYVDDPDAASQVTGIVHWNKNNQEMNQKIQHTKRHSSSYLRAIKEPHLKMLNDDSEAYENSIDLKTCSYHGRQYTEGEQWVDVNDPCETCTCQRGRVVCESEVCFSLNCTHGLAPPIAGRCCPVCKESQLSSLTSHFSVSSPVTPKTCDFMGRKFQSGEKWNPFLPPNGFNRCITCMCGPNGYPTCENVKCPPLSCPLYDRVVDGCCHRCSSRSSLYNSHHHQPQYDQAITDPIAEQQLRERDLLNGGGCRSGGQVYANGKEWHIPLGSFGTSRCTSCKCKDGKRTCFNRHCPVQTSCRNLVTRSSECCPVCLDDQPASTLHRRSSRN